MAGYLPQMEFMDVGPAIQANVIGTKMGVEESQRNLLREVGQTAASGGLDAASKVALRGGDVGTGMKLQEMNYDRQVKMYDFLGRAAVAADTPEKWMQYTSLLAKQFGPESIKGFEDFKSRESAILLSKNAYDAAQQKAASDQFGRALSGGASAGTPQAAIASIESGGRYDAQGPVISGGKMAGDRAYGKYQVMGSNIGPWTQEVLGKPMTPQDFIANPQAQEAVFKVKFGQLAAKHGQEGAARAWFAGEGGMNDPGRSDQLGTTVAQYGQKFTQALGGQPAPESFVDRVSPQALISALANPALPPGQKEVAKMLLAEKIKVNPEIAKLEAFRRDPGLMQLAIDLKKAGATNVTQNNKGENAYEVERAKTRAKRADDFQIQGDKAFSTLGSIQVMRQAVNDPNFYSGTGAEKFALPLKQAIVALGGDPKGAASMEVFRAQANKAVLDSMGGSLGTGFSNADRDFVVSQAPTLGNTPEGSKALLSIMEKVERRKIEIAKLAQEYELEHNRLDAGFDRILTQFRERNPLFSTQEKQEIQVLTAAPADLEAEAKRRGLVK